MTAHLFLDLDGTLIDSCEGIYYSYIKACNHMLIGYPELKLFSQKIGPPIENIFSYFNPQSTSADVENFKMIFRAIYNEEGVKISKCYEDVALQLHYLSKQLDLTLSVITNKPTYPAISILKSHSIFSLFKSVIGSDYLHYHHIGDPFRDKCQAIKYAINKYSVDISRTIYVGDTTSDLEAAQAAGIHFVAAIYGYHNWTDNELIGISVLKEPLNLFSVIEDLLN